MYSDSVYIPLNSHPILEIELSNNIKRRQPRENISLLMVGSNESISSSGAKYLHNPDFKFLVHLF